MAAIAGNDDLHAWVLRGLVEAGFTDATRTGELYTRSGAFSAEHLLANNRGVDGISVGLLGGDSGGQDDEYSFVIKIVRGPSGATAAMRSTETLLFKEYDVRPPESLGARIAQDIRAHSEAFSEWRARGGVASYAERSGVPDARGSPCAAPFSNWLDRRYKAGESLDVGADHQWWNAAYDRKSLGRQIQSGKGVEAYVRHKLDARDRPELKAYIQRAKLAGNLMIAVAVCDLLFVFGMGIYSITIIWDVGLSGWLSARWPVAMSAMSFLLALMWGWAGWALKGTESRSWVMLYTIFGLMPCFGPCCFGHFPFAAFSLWVLFDKRQREVFVEDGGLRSVVDDFF